MGKVDKSEISIAGQHYTLVKGTRWYLEYYSNDRGIPERVRVYGANRVKDIAAREKAFYEIARNIALPQGAACILTTTLNAAKPILRLKTWQSQKARLKYYLEWLGRRSPADIDISQASAFINFLIQNGKASATVGSYRNTLSALYKRAGLANPWRAVLVPSVVSRSLMYFRPSQAALLLKDLRVENCQLALAAQMLYYCFIRPGEMRLLTIDCINLEEGTITIPAGISKNKRTGTVVIPEGFKSEISMLDLEGVPGDFLLFGKYGMPGRVPVGKNYFNRLHSNVLKRCQIKGRYAFYSWKHTGAVMAVKAGINLKDLQLQLRHHSLDMVNEYLKNLGVMDSEDLRLRFPQNLIRKKWSKNLKK